MLKNPQQNCRCLLQIYVRVRNRYINPLEAHTNYIPDTSFSVGSFHRALRSSYTAEAFLSGMDGA